MREHLHSASLRRDERLARIRRLSLWITGGAAAASLGLGTAFAHALPGHSVATAATGASGTTRSASGSSAGAAPGASGTGRLATGGVKSSGHQHKHGLAKPKQQPVSTPAPPVVSSGGS